MVEKSELRLFISMDVVGSTALKNQKNRNTLLQTYRSRSKIVDALEKKNGGSFGFSDDELTNIVLSDLSDEDLDWAAVIERLFEDFHILFKGCDNGRYLGF